MNSDKERIEAPLFLRSIEERKISQHKEESNNEKYCYSQKYHGYCSFQRSNRWKSIAISIHNDND